MAPPPTILQNFEYHWKHVKTFYSVNRDLPKVHIKNTNLPVHLEEMLQQLIDEERQVKSIIDDDNKILINRECFDFVLNNRPIDLLADICLTDSPPGASVCILNWMRRFLSCLEQSRLDHKSIFQPIQKLIVYCNQLAGCASPYEQEEIVFLLTVAGVIRKEPLLLHLFLPNHEHSLATASLDPSLGMKMPRRNTLFENTKLEASVRRISLIRNSSIDGEEQQQIDEIDSAVVNLAENYSCDCKESDSFLLFDAIIRYFDSAVSIFN